MMKLKAESAKTKVKSCEIFLVNKLSPERRKFQACIKVPLFRRGGYSEAF